MAENETIRPHVRHVLSQQNTNTQRTGPYNLFQKSTNNLQKSKLDDVKKLSTTSKDIAKTRLRKPLTFVNENTRLRTAGTVRKPTTNPEVFVDAHEDLPDQPPPPPLFQVYEDPHLAKIPPEITNIDLKYNERDIIGMDNITENFFYLQYLEQVHQVSSEFLSPQNNTPQASHGINTRSAKLVDDRMRVILIEWLMNCHAKLGLRKETLYLGIQILDRFIDICNSPGKRDEYVSRINSDSSIEKSFLHSLKPIYVNKQNLQLIGIGAFVLATKYEEVTFPILEDWVFLSADSIKREEIIEIERRIIKALEFNLSFPNSIDFLRRGSKIAAVDQKTHHVAQFLLETSLYSSQLAPVKESLKACACLYVALRLAGKKTKVESLWSQDLEYFMQLKESEIFSVAAIVCKILVKTVTEVYQKPKAKAIAVFKKYSKPENSCIALDAKIIGERANNSDAVRFNPLILQFAKNKFEYD